MKTWLFFLFTCLGLSVAAQNMTRNDVLQMSMRNSDAIGKNADVRGYYFFYVSHKPDRLTSEYTLEIVDTQLATINKIKFEDNKNVRVLENAFNGDDLIFMFHDRYADLLRYEVYDALGHKKYNYNETLSRKDENLLLAHYNQFANDEDQTYKGLYPVAGDGFLSITPSRNANDYSFQVDFFGTDENNHWVYHPNLGGKRQTAIYLGNNAQVAFFYVQVFNSALDGNPDSYVVGLDLSSGKQLFTNNMKGSRYVLSPISLNTLNNGTTYLFGEYYNENSNVSRDKSNGYGFWAIDNTGKITGEKYLSWQMDIARHTNVSSKGKVENLGYIFLHNMMQMADGKIFIVGEGFRKEASAGGIAANVLGAAVGVRTNAGMAKLRITDLVLMELDPKLDLVNMRVFEKKPNNINLPQGYEVEKTYMLGRAVKYVFGGFDYAYSQVSDDRTRFQVFYNDFVREKDYWGGTFNRITYADGKISTQKINTRSDATRSSILPANDGKVLILEYYRKDRALNAQVQQMN